MYKKYNHIPDFCNRKHYKCARCIPFKTRKTNFKCTTGNTTINHGWDDGMPYINNPTQVPKNTIESLRGMLALKLLEGKKKPDDEHIVYAAEPSSPKHNDRNIPGPSWDHDY